MTCRLRFASRYYTQAGRTVEVSPIADAKLDYATLRTIPSSICALGFVSLLMDVSSEMIHALLPIYLVTVLGASTLTVGVIEGLGEATANITKIFSGAISLAIGSSCGAYTWRSPSAMIADSVPPELRGTAFGVFNFATGLALLAASAVAGALWHAYGPAATFLTGAGFTSLALIGLIIVRRRIHPKEGKSSIEPRSIAFRDRSS